MDETTKRRKETAERRAVAQRNYRRCRDRALTRLANDYPNLYQEYLDEERRKDEQENKVWTDLAGNTKRVVGGSTSYHKSPTRKAKRRKKRGYRR